LKDDHMKKFLFAAAVACTAFCLGCASGERVESKGATTTTKAGCSGEAACAQGKVCSKGEKCCAAKGEAGEAKGGCCSSPGGSKETCTKGCSAEATKAGCGSEAKAGCSEAKSGCTATKAPAGVN
jgi:hypothetical protein